MTESLNFDAHDAAINNINEKALELFEEVQAIKFDNNNLGDFKSDRPIKFEITPDDITDHPIIRSGTIRGEFAISFIEIAQTHYGIVGISISKLDKLISSLSDIQDIKRSASDDYLERKIFEWLGQRKSNSNNELFWVYLKGELKNDVNEMTIFIPIDGIGTEVSGHFKEVSFCPLEKTTFDRWEATCEQNSMDEKVEVQKQFQKLRNEMEGHMAVKVVMQAEPRYADEVAFEKANRVCDCFRIFSPQRSSILDRALYAPLGLSIRPQRHTISINSEDEFSHNNALLDRQGHYWHINKEYLEGMNSDKFLRLYEIAVAGPQTDFEKHACKSFLAFSKSLTAVDLHDRLASRLSAMESLLLKNSSEPIAAMVGDRMAFLLSNKSEERQNIASCFKSVYGMRSDYVHHRITRNDQQEMETFAKNAWRTILTILHYMDHFKTKIDFFKFLEKKRYGG